LVEAPMVSSSKKKLSDGDKKLLIQHWYPNSINHEAVCISCRKNKISFTAAGGHEFAHIVAEAKGGPTTIGNMVPMCRACNSPRAGEDKMRNQFDAMFSMFTDVETRNYTILHMVTKLRDMHACMTTKHPRFRYDMTDEEFVREIFGVGDGAIENDEIYTIVKTREGLLTSLGRAHNHMAEANAQYDKIQLELETALRRRAQAHAELIEIEREHSRFIEPLSLDAAYELRPQM